MPIELSTRPPGRSEGGYRYSYSGSDADTFVWFDAAPELIAPLESVHTISVSVHESKGQARALGHRGIKGLARGVRTIAGSLILTVINDHPLRELMDQYVGIYGTGDPLGWSLDRHMVGVGSFLDNYDYTNRLAVLLRPFNLAVQYVGETGPLYDVNQGERPEGAGWMLKGIEFIDEGQVTSVNDIVTEMTFSFIACDFKPFAYYDTRPSEATILAEAEMLVSQYELYQSLYEDELQARVTTVAGRQEGNFDPATSEQLGLGSLNPRTRSR